MLSPPQAWTVLADCPFNQYKRKFVIGSNIEHNCKYLQNDPYNESVN